MNGDINLENLSDEEKIIFKYIKNECIHNHGACYELYFSLRKIRNGKTKMQIIEVYERILMLLN